MNRRAAGILARFEARADEIADRIAACTVAEVDGFRGINDAMLHAEIRVLARRHLDAFLVTARSGTPPSAQVLAAARERAVLRAREMVPLAALVHSYLIAQRVISAAITRECDTDARSREAALALIAVTFDYNIAVTAAMAEAYVEVVQGDLAELDAARRGLIDALLSSPDTDSSALRRRAIGLGFDPDRSYVAAVAVTDLPDNGDQQVGSPRWAATAIARATSRPDRNTFVVSRERDLVALLDASGAHPPRTVLRDAAAAIRQLYQAGLRTGVGTPFTGLAGFAPSYQQAHRALNHTNPGCPFVFWPDDVLLFDELTASPATDATRLIPEATRRLLNDHTLRATLEAFVAADLNIAAAAHALSLHPNSLRYRLRRIAQQTGRDPRKVPDLLELITAARLLATAPKATDAGP